MKNYKLDVVRFYNEDVIATSGCNVDLNELDGMDYIYKIEEDTAYYYYYEYDSTTGKFGGDDNSSYDDAHYYFGDRLPEEGQWIHYGGEGTGVVCTDPNHHGVPTPEIPRD